MANCIIILGKSGSGKSTSIKTLNPKETVVINILGKKLPFKGSNESYSIDKKNLFRLNTYIEVINYIQNISDNAHHVKNIIIDD